MQAVKDLLPPELEGNYCHIAKEWQQGVNQRLWFVSAPYGGTVLRFRGEPTSLLYAIAPTVDAIKKGQLADLTLDQVALLNPTVASDELYVEIQQRLSRQNLRVLCVSALTASSAEARYIARLAKIINPHTVTIFGGPHEDDILLKAAIDPVFDGIVDFTVAGDGEYALLHLLKIVFDNPHSSADQLKGEVLKRAAEFGLCEGRGGVYFKYDGRPQQARLSGAMLNLDTLPLMPRELLHESDTRTFSIFKKGGWNVKTAQIMTHRGCAWRCSFCSESASLNLRSVESIVREIDEVRHFSERHPQFERDNYQAIFFDDSTFTTNSKRRKDFLRALYPRLIEYNVEWGCQTRLDQIDEETLITMKEAGCSYIYTGLESATDEMLRAMVKDQGRAHIERAFEAINRVGIRLGVSLIFGVAQAGFSNTMENEQSILETLEFVERQTKKGNIVLVSPNLATYYPDTRMTIASHSNIDFRDPIVNRGYPWNRFEEGESYHPEGVDQDMAIGIIEKSVKCFGEYLVDQDICALEEYQQAYRSGALDRSGRVYADLNHASISRPLPEIRQLADFISQMGEVPADLRRTHLAEARATAAALIGLPAAKVENVVLARNTTEASSLVFWLARLYREPEGARVLTTNAENLSIPRAFRFFMDHGNQQGHDLWSSFQDFGAQRQIDYSVRKRKTNLQVDVVDVLSNTSAVEDTIVSNLTPETRLVVFCHVIRDDGRICDVASLCKRIRAVNPDIYILVDGAQALGALRSVSVESLGCDFYVAAPHKTLGSYPLGLLYMSDRVKEGARRLSIKNPASPPHGIIMGGMFAPSLEITPTVEPQLSFPEIVAFTGAVKALRDDGLIMDDPESHLKNLCSKLDERRKNLKQLFIEGLKQMPGYQITSPLDPDHYSNFILTFRFRDQDNRRIVEDLWQHDLIFVSYIARSNTIRASFGPMSRAEDVHLALSALRDWLSASAAKIETGLESVR